MNLSQQELLRYSRHLNLPQFNLESQNKLKKASVLVIGAGALSCSVLPFLTAAGVGNIGIVDFDIIDISNLQRQVLYSTDEVGLKKCEVAKTKMQKLNPLIEIKAIDTLVTKYNIKEIAASYEIIIDATDNFPTRYLINDYCVLNEKVNVHASILQFKGQVSVFNYLDLNGNRSANYRDLYSEPPSDEHVINCAEGGVIGALPGIIGAIQALECIKIITGVGEILANKMIIFDTLNYEFFKLDFESDDENPLSTEKIKNIENFDYEFFCGIKKTISMKSVTVQELNQWMKEGKEFQLIDVREQHEFEMANIDGELIPMNTVPENVGRFSKNMDVVVHCRSGVRSANVIDFLSQQHGYDNLYNLEGGIMAWAREIDPSMQIM